MPYMRWNKFVEKYPGTGYVVTTMTRRAYFKVPPGISPRNSKTFPNILALVKEAIGPRFVGDWSHRTTPLTGGKTVKGRTVTVSVGTGHHFVFSDPADAKTAAIFFRATRPVVQYPGFSGLIPGFEIDQAEYVKQVKALGY